MSVVSYNLFLDEVMPEVPGVSIAQAKAAIRNAAIDFCKRSWCWNMDLDALDLAANVIDYDIEAPANNSVVAAVMILYYNGKKLEPVSRGQLEDFGTDFRTVSGNPSNYLRNTPDSISFYPKPATNQVGAITGKVALAPSRASTGVEKFIYENWLEQIAHGAKAKLFIMNNVPWANPSLSEYHRNLFDSACAAVKLRVQKGHVRSRMRTTPQFF